MSSGWPPARTQTDRSVHNGIMHGAPAVGLREAGWLLGFYIQYYNVVASKVISQKEQALVI